jgi:hypothetical protein
MRAELAVAFEKADTVVVVVDLLWFGVGTGNTPHIECSACGSSNLEVMVQRKETAPMKCTF